MFLLAWAARISDGIQADRVADNAAELGIEFSRDRARRKDRCSAVLRRVPLPQPPSVISAADQDPAGLVRHTAPELRVLVVPPGVTSLVAPAVMLAHQLEGGVQQQAANLAGQRRFRSAVASAVPLVNACGTVVACADSAVGGPGPVRSFARFSAFAGEALPVKPNETSGGLIYPCGLL